MAVMHQNYRHYEGYQEPDTIIPDSVAMNSDGTVSSPLTMEAFLSDIEKRAYHMAAFATGSQADALDLLQDSMIKLVTHYAQHPCEQWKPLFYKILQNRIRDFHRQQKVRNLLFFWKSAQSDDEGEQWPPDAMATTAGTNNGDEPTANIAKTQQQAAALASLKQLSDKQQQCFLLRSWEGLSTAQTAEIMGCSEGSVKTHYSRAVSKLRSLMEADHEITF